jgi:hypothetical protein
MSFVMFMTGLSRRSVIINIKPNVHTYITGLKSFTVNISSGDLELLDHVKEQFSIFVANIRWDSTLIFGCKEHFILFVEGTKEPM